MYDLKLTDRTRYTKPAQAWVAELHEAYASVMPRSAARPWTRAQAINLGTLYARAWGDVPNTSHMGKSYCLPSQAAILKLFGSYAAYWAAIKAALREEGVCL